MLAAAAVIVCACQQQRYSSSGPEVDMMKKADAAYYSGDWSTLKSLYADTAKVIVNRWGQADMTVDQMIDGFKTGLTNYTEYKQGEQAFYNMTVADDGTTYVNSWQEWIGKHQNGKEVRTVVQITAQVAGGKFVWAGFIYDTHPLFMAEQPSDSTVMK